MTLFLVGSRSGPRFLLLWASLQMVVLASSCFSPGIPMPGFTHREVQVYIPYIESVSAPATVAVDQPFDISVVMSSQANPSVLSKLHLATGGDSIIQSEPQHGLTGPALLVHPLLSEDYGERIVNNTYISRGNSISIPGTYFYYFAGAKSEDLGGTPLTVIYGNAGFEIHKFPRSQFRYVEVVVNVI